MLKKILFPFVIIVFVAGQSMAQDSNLIKNIIKDVYENSQLEQLGTELMDGIGPRLVGTPLMKKAHDWAVAKYQGWGIAAENQQWGQWRGWERGITHIDMVSPRVYSLHGQQLAWSPATKKGGVQAEVILLPEAADSTAFVGMLPQVKGKFVLISPMQLSGRPDANWEKFGRKESFDSLKAGRQRNAAEWNKRTANTGYNARTLATALEKAGAAGIIASNWSREYGSNKIFGANTKSIPTVDVSLEDYGMLYRLAQNGQKPVLKIETTSKELGLQPTYNTVATIKGTEKPDEIVMLSAHFDSWDGGTGATDNGTGTMVMMEAMRLLKKWYPNPKRTIMAGHWGSEEQGLNGSRAFVKDHPEQVNKITAVFNQDNGTGRIQSINGSGFLHAYDFMGRWLNAVPSKYKEDLRLDFPGSPGGGGSDHASFVAAGVPAFFLSALSWDYGTATWHTNLDTYDKIVFDDVRYNVIITAILAYMASEDLEMANREKMKMSGSRFGRPITWPEARDAQRKGGVE